MSDLIAKHSLPHKDKHIIEAIADFHMEFEQIHPFVDGNGRTGRLLINFDLLCHNLLPVNIKFADRERYYSCFSAYGSSRDASELALMLAEYELEELERHLKQLELKCTDIH
jgi:Fic family protein